MHLGCRASLAALNSKARAIQTCSNGLPFGLLHMAQPPHWVEGKNRHLAQKLLTWEHVTLNNERLGVLSACGCAQCQGLCPPERTRATSLSAVTLTIRDPIRFGAQGLCTFGFASMQKKAACMERKRGIEIIQLCVSSEFNDLHLFVWLETPRQPSEPS